MSASKSRFVPPVHIAFPSAYLVLFMRIGKKVQIKLMRRKREREE